MYYLQDVCDCRAFRYCRSQVLLNRHGRCLKLFVSTDSTSCHEFASQFGLDIFLYMKNTKNYREYRVAYTVTVYLNEAATGHSTPAKRGRQLRHPWVGAPTHRTATTRMAMLVGWYEHVREYTCVCASVSVRA